jgi:hypothetical protein
MRIAGGGNVNRPGGVIAAECDYAILASTVTGTLETPATCSNARRNVVGNVFPRFAARRSIPRQALALKEYRCGTTPVSKMSDNEDATAALGNSNVLSVKNSVGEPIPELPQDSDKEAKRPSSIH